MSDLIQDLFDAGLVTTTLFAPSSRYHTAATAQLAAPDGRRIVYLRRRFIQQSDVFAVMFEHVVVDGDRGDLLAAKYLGDPELAWQLCDANAVLDPDELTARAGTSIRVTLPAGVVAPRHE